MDFTVYVQYLCVVVSLHYCAAIYTQFADIGTNNVVLHFNYSWTGGSKLIACSREQTLIGQCAGNLAMSCSVEQPSVGVYSISSNQDLTSLYLTVLHFNETMIGNYSCSKPNCDTTTISLEKTPEPRLNLVGYITNRRILLMVCTVSSDISEIQWLTYDETQGVTVVTQEYRNNTCKVNGTSENLKHVQCFCISKTLFECVIMEWTKGHSWLCYIDKNSITYYSNNFTSPDIFLEGLKTNNGLLLVCTKPQAVHTVHWYTYNGSKPGIVAIQENVNGQCNSVITLEHVECFCNSSTVYSCFFKDYKEGHMWNCHADVNGETTYSNIYTIPKDPSSPTPAKNLLSVGIIFGVSGIAVVVSIVYGIWLWKRRKRNSDSEQNTETQFDISLANASI